MLDAPPRRRKYRILPARRVRAAAPDLEALALERFGRARRELIAEAAYYLSLHGGADPDTNWLAAERQIDAALQTPAASPAGAARGMSRRSQK